MSDYTDLVEYLREMYDVMLYDDSIESGMPEEMITDIDAIACKEAADVIEQLVKERDAELVRYGHWITYADNKRECYCSNCEFPAGLDTYGYHNMQDPYCRFCGAKMMDEVNE